MQERLSLSTIGGVIADRRETGAYVPPKERLQTRKDLKGCMKHVSMKGHLSILRYIAGTLRGSTGFYFVHLVVFAYVHVARDSQNRGTIKHR